MTHPYTDVDSFATVTLPDDSDPPTAGLFNTSYEALADRTYYLRNRIAFERNVWWGAPAATGNHDPILATPLTTWSNGTAQPDVDGYEFLQSAPVAHFYDEGPFPNGSMILPRTLVARLRLRLQLNFSASAGEYLGRVGLYYKGANGLTAFTPMNGPATIARYTSPGGPVGAIVEAEISAAMYVTAISTLRVAVAGYDVGSAGEPTSIDLLGYHATIRMVGA